MAPPNATSKMSLSEKEMQVLALAWQCMEIQPKIDINKLSKLAGYTPGSASVTFGKIKTKLKALAESTGVDSTGDAPADSIESPEEEAPPSSSPQKAARKPRAKPKAKAGANARNRIPSDSLSETAAPTGLSPPSPDAEAPPVVTTTSRPKAKVGSRKRKTSLPDHYPVPEISPAARSPSPPLSPAPSDTPVSPSKRRQHAPAQHETDDGSFPGPTTIQEALVRASEKGDSAIAN